MPAWVAPALRAVALKAHVNALLPHQLAFIMGSLERAGCRIPMPLMDQVWHTHTHTHTHRQDIPSHVCYPHTHLDPYPAAGVYA